MKKARDGVGTGAKLRTAGAPYQALVRHRKMWVARFRARGMSMNEITAAMAKPRKNLDTGIEEPISLNPRTGKPWSIHAVQMDCHEAEKRWLEEEELCTKERKTLRSRLQAELREVRRAAWMRNHFPTILKSIQQERDLFGLDEPAHVEHGGSVELDLQFTAAMDKVYGKEPRKPKAIADKSEQPGQIDSGGEESGVPAGSDQEPSQWTVRPAAETVDVPPLREAG